MLSMFACLTMCSVLYVLYSNIQDEGSSYIVIKSSANSQLPTVGYAVICESLQSDEKSVDIAM